MIFFSKSTNGFYASDVHGERFIDAKPNPATRIPADAVEITIEEHAALLAAQSAGRVIEINSKGRPVAVDRAPPPPEEVWASVRTRRNALLSETDFGRDAPDSIVEKFRAYRQELRDIPQKFTDPSKIVWPAKPQ